MVDSASGLKIWTNQSYYYAGQTLKGAVLLDSSVTPNEEITFRFKGVDDCIVEPLRQEQSSLLAV